MAKTINLAFLELKQNLNITGLQTTTVSTRQSNVRKVMGAGITILDSFLTGSYSRSTMITPLNEADIDIFFVLDPSYYHHYNGQNGGPAGLLDFVKRTLKKTYSRTPDISRDGQAVTIQFEDFMVDVVPGFNRQGGGYLITNSIRQSWISTNPKKHVEIISLANNLHNGDLVPLIKMVKGWNKNNGRFFHSFHLEVLVYEALKNVTISDFPSGVRYFFNKAINLVTKQNPDPAGYGGHIGSYINTQEKINEAVGKFQKAYETSVRAESYASRGFIKYSIEEWKKIFGDYFPSYG